MPTAEENRKLMEVGRGTPMGELMRRYWHPIAAVGELHAQPVKPVRLMGEDLALYKDRSGTYGLLEQHCAHRRADLTYGIVEERGLRCNYHGWLYDETGQCLAQPFDDVAHPEARFKERIRLAAYPVQAKAGLVWAYLGPQPAPLVPDWEPFSWDDGFVQVVFSDIPCNWFQCQENSIDPVHLEWLHTYWSYDQKRRPGPVPGHHLKVGFDEFEHGFVYRRVMEGATEEDELWTVGRTCLWPNALFTGSTTVSHFEWRVPVDDTNTLSVGWFVNRAAPGHALPSGPRVRHWYSPLKDPATGRWITTHTMNQDFVAWVGQGTLADRTLEHLSPSDRGIIMLRQKFLDQMEVVARGEDPKGTFRDPEANRALRLTLIGRGRPDREQGAGVLARFDRFPWLVGQPPEVEEDFRKVIATWSLL
jgi:5,5'-dehydrodivanillate O-demethylase